MRSIGGVLRRRSPGADDGIWSPFRSLLLAQVVAAGFGFVFWVLAARLVDAEQVGIAASAISVQTLLGIVAAVGLGTTFVAELPLQQPARQRRLLQRGLLVVMLVGGLLGGVVLGFWPLLTSNLHEALGNPVGASTFVLGVIVAGWSLVVDDSCLAVRRSEVQVGRNLLASGLRFPLTVVLIALGHTEAWTLQVCWVLPLVVSIPVSLWRLRLPRDRGSRPTLWSDVTTYAGPALRNHALSLSLTASSQLVPVIAGVTLSAVSNAEFAIAWLMATFVFLPPYLLSTALFAHGANVSTEEFKSNMARTIPAALTLSAALCVGAWVLGEPALLVFGGDYPVKSWQILALLVPGGLWMVFKDHLVALWRSQRRFGLATRLAAAAVLLEMTGALIGALVAGAIGLCVGWLLATGIEVLLAIPWLRQAFGGLAWQWPRLRRSEAGRGGPTLVAGLAVLGVVLGVTMWMANGARVDDGAEPGAGADGGSRGSPSGSPTSAGCERTADRPGPLVDLGVQASRGDQRPRLLSERQVRDLVGLAKGAGASVISTSASFRAMQPRAGEPYQFTGLDRVLTAAKDAGLTVRLRLLGLPTWAQDDPSDGIRQAPRSDAELARWATFVRDVLTHAGDAVGYVEVWTEPNSSRYWPTGPDAVEFARLLRVTYDTAKAVDPDVQIISGGLRGNDLGYVKALYEGIDAIESPDVPFDLLGVEPFNGGAAPDVDNPGDVYSSSSYGPIDNNFLGFQRVHDAMGDAGDDRPLYITLFGYSTEGDGARAAVPDEQRAGYLTSAFSEATCYPYVEGFSWYAFHPNPWDPPSWTLLGRTHQPTATYDALADWSAAGVS